MLETNRKDKSTNKRDTASEVRVVVEVDGNPVGFLSLDIERLWPLINHRKRDTVPVEWMDSSRFETLIRAAVAKRLMTRIESDMYQALGNQMVKAELDVESFMLKAEAAAQAFGRRRSDIENLAADSDRTPVDFYAFFWDYLMDDREVVDLKKEWKAAVKKV
jgi:hypothetical protein